MPSESIRTSILDTAKRYVTQDRNAVHGDPEDNFTTIADFWRTYSLRRWGLEVPFHPVDVAMMTALIKVSRIANTPQHEDSYVDLAGYAACGGEVAQKFPYFSTIPAEAALSYAKPLVQQVVEDLEDALEGFGVSD